MISLSKSILRKKIVWIVVGLLVCIGALLVHQHKLQQDDEALRIERLDKKNKLKLESPLLGNNSVIEESAPQTEQQRLARHLKNQAGDFLVLPWNEWLSVVPKILEDDASIIEFRTELPRITASKYTSISDNPSPIKIYLQLEVRDDVALKRILARFSLDQKLSEVRIESAIDQARGAEKYLVVNLNIMMAI